MDVEQSTYHEVQITGNPREQEGHSVMALACKTAIGTGSLVFIDVVTTDGSSKMNSEV